VVEPTPLKNSSQNGNLPQIGVKIKKIETTTQIAYLSTIHYWNIPDVPASLHKFASRSSWRRILPNAPAPPTNATHPENFLKHQLPFKRA